MRLFTLFLLLISAQLALAAQERYALVIGNAAYKNETPLVNTQWILLGYSEAGDFNLSEPGTAITASFSEDGNIAGFGSCNAYAGPYEVDEDQISIGPLAATTSFCEESSDQEAAYLAALESAETFNIFGQRLSITFNEGDSQLVFTSANLPLTGTLWT